MYAILFAVLAWFEANGSFMNAFVLLVIAITFFKGFIVKRRSYGFVASMIAVIFAILMTLVFLAVGSFSYGIFGYSTLPAFIWYRRRLFIEG